jgi:ABC-type sugar transport system permease subunit
MDIAAAYSIIIFLLNILFSLFYVKILKTNDN